MEERKTRMKVLVTGGTGTISSGIVSECVLRGYDVVALTRGNNRQRNIEGARYLYCDTRKPESVKKALGDSKFDVVIECLVYETWQLKISLNTFADICKQYVFISTAAVYSQKEQGRISENDEKNSTSWSYSRNKIECEKYLIDYCNKSGLIYTIIRPTVTYGEFRIPFPIATRNPGWTFFQRMIDNKPMLAGDNILHSIIHIDDFSKHVVNLLGNEMAYNEDFHISSNNNDVYWDDVIRIAGEKLGVTPVIIHVPAEDFKKVYPQTYEELVFHKNRSILLDDRKIHMASDYKTKIGIEEGVDKIINSMRREFDSFGLNIDKVWNDYCDATIYYAYKHNHISEEEKKALDTYYSEQGVVMMEKNLKMVRARNLQRKIHKLEKKARQLIRK